MQKWKNWMNRFRIFYSALKKKENIFYMFFTRGSGIALIQKETSLPVVVDLSHSLGRKDILPPVAKAVLAMGIDGIMLEVHPQPEYALSDQQQQLNLDELDDFLQALY